MDKLNDNFIEYINGIFEEYLLRKVGTEEAKNTIIKKSEEIINHMISFRDIKQKDKRKFLMVGKVQSGKTINFISTIVSAYKKGINLIIVFTSYDQFLNNQTINNINEALNPNNILSNFISMYQWEDMKNERMFFRNILSDIEKNKLNIIVSIKSNISKINGVFHKYDLLRNTEMLIIDDEGDLGSMTHDKKKYSKTHEEFIKLLEITNSFFLSVTATPQVHLLTEKNKFLKPSFVYTINPGKEYKGLEHFEKNKNKYFKIIEDDVLNDWWKTEVFKESVLYYIITTANLLKENIFEKKVILICLFIQM